MDGQQFDALILRLQRTIDRRHVVSGLVAGSAALAGIQISAEAKKRGKRKKKRCGRLQARCRSNKECCPRKTGRVCASNDQDVQCIGGGRVCCLPVLSFGCNDDCDCCGPNAGCNAPTGQCVAK